MLKLQTKYKIIVLIGLVACGLLLAYGLTDEPDMTVMETQAGKVHDHEHLDQETLYVCPMMCIPPREQPGQCPICGMDLVPANGGAHVAGPPRLRLSDEAVKLAAIETAPVERKFVHAQVRLYGQIDYDPAHITKIAAFMPGVIDRVYVKRAGQFVRWGEPLFDLYSSDLLETQKQLVEAMKFVPSFMAFQAGMPHAAKEMPVQERVSPGEKHSPEAEAALNKLAAIRHKLSILGLPKRDIDELMKRGEATGIATIYSSVYGQVIEEQAFEGTFVNTGTTIFTIGDPNYVWVKLDAYEADYPWLRKGQAVTFEMDAYPGETFSAKVVYIDPVFNNQTRTFSVGAICPDTGGKLKAGMLVRAVIQARLTAEGNVAAADEPLDKAPLVIPATAPLITGKRAVVYVKSPRAEGRFEGREVVLGPRASGYYLVKAGLEEHEEVVKHGSFKIDSSLQIMAQPSMMSTKGGNAAVGYQNPGGSQLIEQNYLKQRANSRQTVVRDEDAQTQHDPRRPHSPERRTIQRRKPGAYGDITRQRQRRLQ